MARATPEEVSREIATLLALDRAAMRVPSVEKATPVTESPWPSSRATSFPVARSQSRAVRSPDPVARRVPSGEKATLITSFPWPASRAISVPVAKSHNRADRS